jgi:dipeptidyl aminopeptidase/acylaminoacyl peptidase
MNADGGDKRQLTFNTPGANITPAESPDGRHIAFSGIRGDNRPEVWVMNADGTGQKQLTTTPRVLPKASAAQSQPQSLFETLPPKMKKLEKELPGWLQNADHRDRAPEAMSLLHQMQEAIKANRFEEAEKAVDSILKMMGFSPQDVVREAPTIFEMSSSMHPAWSADGKQLAFASTRFGSTQIWVMNSDGTNQRQLTHGLGGRFPDANVPCWSLDGRLITFWAGYERRYGEVWVMNADGTHPRRITHTLPPANSDDPRWSPDATKIIYGSGSPAGRDMYVVDLQSGATRLFAKNIQWCDWQNAQNPPR